MSFEHPYRLFLLFVPALLVGVYAAYWSWKRRCAARLGDPALVAAMAESRSGRRETAAALLASLALALVAIGLAGPQWGERQERVEQRGIDIVFALDISRSMLAEDVPPSRLAAAKTEIERILAELRGDRVALVGFAGIAFSQCPLTADYSAIRRFLRGLDPGDLPIQGTAVGRAISEAQQLLLGRRGPKDDDEDPSLAMERGHDQIVVLITDGEDHESGAVEAAREAAEAGIRVFTVAIGSEDGAEVPDYGPNGRRRGALRDAQGNVVVSAVDRAGLDAIAAAGNGIAMSYTGQGSVSAMLANEVDALQSAELDSILRPQREDRFYLFVAPAVLMLFIALGLSDRRRGVPEVGWLVVALAAFLGTTAQVGCGDAFVYESDEVADGLVASDQGDPEGGLAMIRGFREQIAPEDLLDERALTYNEGVVLLQGGQLDDAQDAFSSATGSRDEAVQFGSYYNLGNIAFLEERYRDAYDRYVQALELRPDDEDAKWNLEVTLRRLYPPCRELDDPLEDNDGPEQAGPYEVPAAAPPLDPLTGAPAPGVGSGVVTPGAAPADAAADPAPLVLCGGDADWYRVDAPAGGYVSVGATFDRLRDDDGGAALPDTLPADAVSLTLYATDGVTVLASDNGERDRAAGRERVDPDGIARDLAFVEVPADLPAGAPLYLAVETFLGLEMSYELEVEVLPPCSALEDAFEDNDARELAADLDTGEHEAQSCSGDEDWYAISAEAGDTIFVDIQPGATTSPLSDADDHGGEEHGDDEHEHTVALRAELYRAGEAAPVDVSYGRDGLLELSQRDILETGTYHLRVRGLRPEDEGAYTLSVYRFAPCIAGDDRLEQNDEPAAAALLDPQQAPFRHLRLCEGDPDWFRLAVEEGEHVSVSVEWEEPERQVRLALTEPGTATVVAYGVDQTITLPPPPPPEALLPPLPRATRARQVHLEEPAESGEFGVFVSGDPGFYNITLPEPNEDSQCDNPQPDEDGDQQDDGDPQDDDQQDPQDSEGDGEPEEQEQNDQQDPEQGEQEEPEDDGQDDQEQAADQQEQEQQQQQQPEPRELSEAEQREARLRQLLESLSDDQMNLQLQQALEQLPPIRVERQW
jgi:Ca-activated chloride channel family protein